MDYKTKALKAADPRFAQIFRKLGYQTRHVEASPENAALEAATAPATAPKPEKAKEGQGKRGRPPSRAKKEQKAQSKPAPRKKAAK